MDLKLQGQPILVTGGAGGIGSRLCRRLADEGAIVVVIDIDGSRASEVALSLQSGDCRNAYGFEADSSDPTRMSEIVESVRHATGREIYGLATCAGVVERAGFLDGALPELLRRQFELHVIGPAVATQAVLPSMLIGGGGSIVHISSSVNGHSGRDLFAYSTSKAAAAMIAPSVVNEFGKRGIRAVTICPGRVGTASALSRAASSADLEAEMLSTQVSGRWIDPDRVADVMAFYLSSCSEGCEGAVVDVTGGNWTSYGRVSHLGGVVSEN